VGRISSSGDELSEEDKALAAMGYAPVRNCPRA
jgi:hypothetical protein